MYRFARIDITSAGILTSIRVLGSLRNSNRSQNVESIGLTLGPENETTLLTQYGTVPRENSYTGWSEDVGLLVANGKTGSGIAVISEVPGYMKRTEIGGWGAGDAMPIGVMYDTDLMPFERTLPPGAEFEPKPTTRLATSNFSIPKSLRFLN